MFLKSMFGSVCIMALINTGFAAEQNELERLFTQYAFARNQVDFGNASESPELSDTDELVDLDGPDEWNLRLTPHFWMSGMDLDATVAGSTTEVDVSFKDIIDDFDVIGASSHFEAWKNNDWGIFVSFSWMRLDGDFKIEDPGSLPVPINFEIDVEVEQIIAAVGLVENVKHENISDDPEQPRFLDVDVFGGIQYQYLRQEIKVTPGPGLLGTSKDWLEPIVGARLNVDLNEKVSFNTMGDVGGFGIGSASDLTAKYMAGFSFKTSESATLRLHYRLIYTDYSNGSGSKEFGLKGLTHGPWIGWTFMF